METSVPMTRSHIPSCLAYACGRPRRKLSGPSERFEMAKHVLPVHAGSLRAQMCADLEASP